MTMPVNGKQLAALRAQLAGRLDEHKELLAKLDWSVDAAGYAALLDAAFSEAVNRRFNGQPSTADISAYVADVRARTGRAGEGVDPDAAERLIGAVLGRSNVEDLDPRTAIAVKQYLLVALVTDAGYDQAALDQFLLEASKLADQWLAR
jgi:hypothetical protein